MKQSPLKLLRNISECYCISDPIYLIHIPTQWLGEYWGDETLSYYDGQRFPFSGKIRNSTSIVKYFGFGNGAAAAEVTFYTHTFDRSSGLQYSQYGSKAITSTERDATYVLDEILAKEFKR